MTIRAFVQMAICVGVFGCQGHSWVPPDDAEQTLGDAGAAHRDAFVEDESVAQMDALSARILVPREGQACARVGEFVHLEASIVASDAVSVKWSFARAQEGCAPVTLAEIDSPTTHTDAYSMFVWSTSCANDIPNECGLGPGHIVVDVTDRIGVTVSQRVAFCLERARESTPSVAAAAD